jgi:hypothetical protein
MASFRSADRFDRTRPSRARHRARRLMCGQRHNRSAGCLPVRVGESRLAASPSIGISTSISTCRVSPGVNRPRPLSTASTQ